MTEEARTLQALGERANWRLGDAGQHYLTARAGRFRPGLWEQQRSMLHKRIYPALGDMTLFALLSDARHVEVWIDSLHPRLSNQTRARLLDLLRAVVKNAVQGEAVPTSEAGAMSKNAQDEPPPKRRLFDPRAERTADGKTEPSAEEAGKVRAVWINGMWRARIRLPDGTRLSFDLERVPRHDAEGAKRLASDMAAQARNRAPGRSTQRETAGRIDATSSEGAK